MISNSMLIRAKHILTALINRGSSHGQLSQKDHTGCFIVVARGTTGVIQELERGVEPNLAGEQLCIWHPVKVVLKLLFCFLRKKLVSTRLIAGSTL